MMLDSLRFIFKSKFNVPEVDNDGHLKIAKKGKKYWKQRRNGVKKKYQTGK